MTSIIKGDILKYTQKGYHIVICHQTNCQTINAGGLAKAIFDKYPETNIYNKNEYVRIPGEYIALETKDGKTVLNLNGQNYPGKINNIETKEKRLQWMKQALDKVSLEYRDRKNYLFLFPSMMGCGLAGGDWNDYHNLICDFEEKGHNVSIIDFN